MHESTVRSCRGFPSLELEVTGALASPAFSRLGIAMGLGRCALKIPALTQVSHSQESDAAVSFRYTTVGYVLPLIQKYRGVFGCLDLIDFLT